MVGGDVLENPNIWSVIKIKIRKRRTMPNAAHSLVGNNS